MKPCRIAFFCLPLMLQAGFNLDNRFCVITSNVSRFYISEYRNIKNEFPDERFTCELVYKQSEHDSQKFVLSKLRGFNKISRVEQELVSGEYELTLIVKKFPEPDQDGKFVLGPDTMLQVHGKDQPLTITVIYEES